MRVFAWTMTWQPDSQLSLNGRVHWRQLKRLKDAAHERMVWEIRQADIGPAFPLQQARVTFEFLYPTKRRRDPDNLCGMVKPLLDALCHEGILFDDDCDHIELLVRARKEAGFTGLKILVEEIDA